MTRAVEIFRDRTFYLFFMWIVIFGMLVSCGGSQGESSSEVTVENPDRTREVVELMDKKDQIPDVPRRLLIRESEWANKKTLTAGINTSFAGSTFAVETEIAMNMRYSIVVWMFAPGITDALTDDDSIFLANSSSRPYNFICRYQGFLDIDPKFRQKITLFGNGLSNEDSYRQTTGVIQTSDSFDVPIGGSWLKVFEKCENYAADTNMMESVERDLKRMTKGLVYHDDKSLCMVDEHCQEWHSTLISSVQDWTVPVCKKQSNGNRFCQIAGARGSSCSLYDSKTKEILTSGDFEYPCAAGLKCTAVKKGGWFVNGEIYTTWKAECR